MTTLDFDRLEALYEATRVPEGWGGPLGEWVIDTHAAFPALLAAARRAERYERQVREIRECAAAGEYDEDEHVKARLLYIFELAEDQP